MQDPVRPNRRQLQAAQTRRDILAVAVRLFTERGYARTSIADLAREAGVAVQTIYAGFGSKREIVAALIDDLDDRADIPQIAAQITQATDPHQAIALMVRLTRQLNERCEDILAGLYSAAQVEPEIAAAVDDGNTRHRAGATHCANRLAELGALRAGLDPRTAATTIAVLTSIEVHVQLHKDHHWTYDQSEKWMNTTLARLLLGQEPTAG